jgi:hypothetical protein
MTSQWRKQWLLPGPPGFSLICVSSWPIQGEAFLCKEQHGVCFTSDVGQISPPVVVILKICRIWFIDAVKYCKVRMELRELVKHTSLCSVVYIVSAHLLCESTTDKLSVWLTFPVSSGYSFVRTVPASVKMRGSMPRSKPSTGLSQPRIGTPIWLPKLAQAPVKVVQMELQQKNLLHIGYQRHLVASCLKIHSLLCKPFLPILRRRNRSQWHRTRGWLVWHTSVFTQQNHLSSKWSHSVYLNLDWCNQQLIL